MRHLLMIKTLDVRDDLFKTVLHRKMTRVETVHLRIRQVSQISFSSFACEEYVILSPKDECLWLAIAQELLPLRVQHDVRSVIVEKIHLDEARIGPLHEAEVHVPVVGTDQIRMLVAVEVYRLDRVKLKQTCHTLLALCGAFFPECIAQPCPCSREAFLVRIGVLNDEPLQRIGTACNDSEAYRASIILDEEAVTIESLLRQEFCRDFSESVERVRKVRRIRHLAVAEPGIIRCDDVKAVGERWSIQTVERCIEQCLRCSRWSAQCRAESLNEDPIMMRDCIRLCNECLELCRTCVALLTRSSGF